MTVARKINDIMANASWIHDIFEEDARLDGKHGIDEVFDFTLESPNLSPPEQFGETLRDTVDSCGLGDHCYMPQVGYPQVCDAIAEYLATEQKTQVSCSEIIMTCGSAGALNVIFKALLDPGDQVLTVRPSSLAYGFYAENHGGVIKSVGTKPDFSLDLSTLAGAIGDKTKIVLINSPNNPTGRIYDMATMDGLGRLMKEKSRQFGRTIYLVSHEPFRKIVFDDVRVPSVFQCYDDSIIATSYSRDIAIAGERIGFAAVNPAAVHKEMIMAGMAMANRILGFVNAPSLMQRVVAFLQGVSVDVGDVQRKRDLLCEGLTDAGYDFTLPQGTFFVFPRTPIADDVAFVEALQEESVLVVPGCAFSGPGHFRISFCVDDQTIVDAMPAFQKVMAKFK